MLKNPRAVSWTPTTPNVDEDINGNVVSNVVWLSIIIIVTSLTRTRTLVPVNAGVQTSVTLISCIRLLGPLIGHTPRPLIGWACPQWPDTPISGPSEAASARTNERPVSRSCDHSGPMRVKLRVRGPGFPQMSTTDLWSGCIAPSCNTSSVWIWRWDAEL